MEPVLSIFPIETFDINLIALKDISTYPNGYNIVSPFLEVEIPSFGTKKLSFIPNDINVLNSTILGLTKQGSSLIPLPDGIYKFKYSINPAYKYNTTKTLIRVDNLYKKFDEIFLSIQDCSCGSSDFRNKRMQLNEIEWYIQGAISSANNCYEQRSVELYKKASGLIDKLNDSKC